MINTGLKNVYALNAKKTTSFLLGQPRTKRTLFIALNVTMKHIRLLRLILNKTAHNKAVFLYPFEGGEKMESADRIEITFKSGETISYGKGEWDDYAYDGKAIIIKQKGAWIGIYNFDDVFCVELK